MAIEELSEELEKLFRAISENNLENFETKLIALEQKGKIKEIISYKDRNQTFNPWQKTLLNFACIDRNLEIVKLLLELEKGAEVNRSTMIHAKSLQNYELNDIREICEHNLRNLVTSLQEDELVRVSERIASEFKQKLSSTSSTNSLNLRDLRDITSEFKTSLSISTNHTSLLI